jgi:uncharacterized protein
MKKKKFLFDIVHLAHFNFFKNAMLRLKEEGHNVEVTFLDRGKIGKVLQKEIPQFKITKLGTYSESNFGKIFMILRRAILFQKYLHKSKPNITTGVGDFILAFSSRIRGIPSIMFYDDYEFKVNYKLSEFFGNRLFVPYPLPKSSRKIVRYSSFKELAYLHPNNYQPNKQIIEKIGLKSKEYVFVREVAGISMNYSDLKECSSLPIIKYLHSLGKKVILSLEDKSKKKLYQPYCLILEEPLDDLYSIMAHAKFMISSGDSMARESALLGVPCIYTGGRNMYVNNPFLKWGGIIKLEDKEQILKKVDYLLNNNFERGWKKEINKIIRSKLINPTELMIKILKRYC